MIAQFALVSSTSIKCPSVAYFLAGSKKVQQALAAPGAVEKCGSQSACPRRACELTVVDCEQVHERQTERLAAQVLRGSVGSREGRQRGLSSSLFARSNMWFALPVRTPRMQTKDIIAKAIANPDDFVLKPQREGGGNNVWGQDISKVQQQSCCECVRALLNISALSSCCRRPRLTSARRTF